MESKTHIDRLIELALEEDLSSDGDVTSNALISSEQISNISIVSREKGIFFGKEIISKVFEKIDPSVSVTFEIEDGTELHSSTLIAVIHGPLKSILLGERTVLNFVQHLSGVATATNSCVDVLKKTGSKTRVRDTRKTLPGYRALEKQAVVAGGGMNHRMGLYDAFLVKDNHLAGVTIEEVVERCRSSNPLLPLEVEVDNIEQLKAVMKSRPDLIMLDNFKVEDIELAKNIVGSIPLEVSGGVTIGNLVEFGSTNVDFIAIGAITHSAKALDIGFDY